MYVFVLFLIYAGPFVLAQTDVGKQLHYSLVIALLLWPVFMIPIGTRLAMVLPATALERRTSFGQAWTMTRGSMWRMSAVVVICSLPFVLFNRVILLILFESVLEDVWLRTLVEVLYLAIFFVQAAVTAAALSLIYRWIGRNTKQEGVGQSLSE